MRDASVGPTVSLANRFDKLYNLLMPPAPPFPSLRVTARSLEPQGVFAQALAEYLLPDSNAVERLDHALSRQRLGIVAHYYMDPELQGVLTALKWDKIHISDSLVMSESAVQMVRAGVAGVVVLGVDFMAENVRATLDAQGFSDVPVWRVSEEPIGCSLAEAADRSEYVGWLSQARYQPNSLHVIYINTSLVAKARAQAVMPTIACTSANVVNTILRAAEQIPEVNIWYGPDTYMGRNIHELLGALLEPSLGTQALASRTENLPLGELRERFHYYQAGHCVVHHLFGAEVAGRVERDYQGALLTAHLEVPGSLFRLAMAAQLQGRGVVGSTSDILQFVGQSMERSATTDGKRLQIVLGTEAGLVTSMVQTIRSHLTRDSSRIQEVEIVFPVAEDAVAPSNTEGLAIVPGAAPGEGCSLEGGCATCPYMKMNSLEALFSLLEALSQDPSGAEHLTLRRGLDMEAGMLPILRMQEFRRLGRLPEELVKAVRGR